MALSLGFPHLSGVQVFQATLHDMDVARRVAEVATGVASKMREAVGEKAQVIRTHSSSVLRENAD